LSLPINPSAPFHCLRLQHHASPLARELATVRVGDSPLGFPVPSHAAASSRGGAVSVLSRSAVSGVILMFFLVMLAMALQDDSSATSYSPQLVGNAFVNQYYYTLRNTPEHAHRFYYDSSTLGREDSNGNMTSVTTLDGISAQIMSTDYTGYVMELQTVDSQASHGGGVLILVAGSFTTPDAVKKKFTQSFFLAPQENGGYFVLNDMFRFVSEMPSTVITEEAGHDNGSTQRATLPAESGTASAQESTVPDLPSAASLPVNRIVTSPSANGAPSVTIPSANGVKAANNGVVKMPEAAPAAPVEKVATTTASVEKAAPVRAPAEKAATTAPAPAEKATTTSAPAPAEKATTTSAPAPAEKAATTSAPAPPAMDVTKRTYASIVKDMRESTLPALAPAVKPKPSPRPKAAQNAEKSASSPAKPVHATNTAPSGDKNTSKSKQPDEPGYSVFVKNLPYNASAEMVEQEFKKFGPIKPEGIQVRNSQVDRFCFGFVEFESQQSMQAAIEARTVYFGSRESYVEEKRTSTRVVNGIITRGDDNGNAGGGRFQSGRGGYQGENFRGNNGNYHDGDNMRNGYRNHQNDYGGRGQRPQGNGYHQNGSNYHQNKNGYHQNGNGYRQNGYVQNVNDQQRRPSNNGNGTGNGKVERANATTKQTLAAA
ncbi:hypothetical protein EJB05_11416, partial [Eragrostis curvula]